jgi:glycosyltransferase involved in cell wall biosynthesis|tara:strand:+ start:842 stop:1702 length:861 start_codon:yes stop_codon:yes gene_type:complete
MNSKISIYVPAFNAEKTIRLCINSILTQTLMPNKILIINDGSTDNTHKILLSFGNKITIINNPTNLGVSRSMNIANENLNTRFVAKIDADVELCPDWIELLINKIQEKDVTLIGGKMYEKYLKNSFNLWRSKRLKQNWGENDLSSPNFIFGCNNILDTSKIDNLKKYRTDLDYFKTNGEDIEFSNYLKMNNQKLYYYSNAICYHLQNDNALSLTERYWRYIHYGDGLKKRNFIKTIKNIIRQFKKTIKWSIEDILNFNLKLLIVNFIIFYHFLIIDSIFYKKNKDE